MKLATIGRGFIVDQAIDALKDVPEITLEAAYSRKLEDARQFADKYNIPKAYADLDELFADPDVDTVYIASPNALHYPQAKKALEARKNVILEKPFVSTTEQAKDLFDTAEQNGVMIFEAITTHHTDNFKTLKDQLDRAGKIRQVLLNFSQYSSRYDQYKEGIVTNAFDPAFDGGALMDINLYNIHFATGLFGEPDKILYLPNIGFNGIDTSGVLLMKYPDFTVTAIGAKDSSAPYEFIISGEEGTFIVDQGGVNMMNHVVFRPVPKKEEIPEEISAPHRNRMSFEFRDFARAIEQKDHKSYEDWKKQTLVVQKILELAKKQRDEKIQTFEALPN